MNKVLNIIMAVFFFVYTSFVIVHYKNSIDAFEREQVAQRAREEQFIRDCSTQGKRVESVGSPFSTTYLVCNP